MDLQEFIQKLQILQGKHGNCKLRFTANDFFSKYGKDIDIDLRVGENTGMPTDFNGFACNLDAQLITLQFHIRKNEEGKNPKITFR